MKSKKLNILKFLIIFVIIILILLSILIYYFLQNKEDSVDTNTQIANNTQENLTENNNVVVNSIEINDQELTSINSTLSKVSDVDEYFLVKSCVDKYFRFISYLDINYEYEFEDPSEEESVKEEERNEYFSMMYDILDEEYIESYNLTVNSLKEIYTSYCTTEYLIETMYKRQISENLNAYVLYGKYVETRDEYEYMDYAIIVKTDSSNNTFSIYLNDYLEDNNYLNLEEGYNLNLSNESNIVKNDYNVYKEDDVDTSEQALAIYYFNLYEKQLLLDLEGAYDLLNEEYREIRFQDEDEYIDYMNENIIGNIGTFSIQKYKVTNFTRSKEIICLDEYDNYFVFEVTNPGEYTVFLDTYTVMLSSQEGDYDDLFPSAKCSYNIDRFIKGINEKNYNFSYSVLTDSFRISNYTTIESFIEFVQNNFFEENEVTYGDITMTNDSSYNYNVTISDATGNIQRQKDITFTINLKSNGNFELSFTIN